MNKQAEDTKQEAPNKPFEYVLPWFLTNGWIITWLIAAPLIFVGLAGLLFITPRFLDPETTEPFTIRGQFGDMFGAITSLISLITCLFLLLNLKEFLKQQQREEKILNLNQNQFHLTYTQFKEANQEKVVRDLRDSFILIWNEAIKALDEARNVSYALESTVTSYSSFLKRNIFDVVSARLVFDFTTIRQSLGAWMSEENNTKFLPAYRLLKVSHDVLEEMRLKKHPDYKNLCLVFASRLTNDEVMAYLILRFYNVGEFATINESDITPDDGLFKLLRKIDRSLVEDPASHIRIVANDIFTRWLGSVE